MSKPFWLVPLVLIVSCSAAFGQLQLRHIEHAKPAAKSGPTNARVGSEPISLPFWDDFSRSVNVPDSNLWESGENVFVNNTIGENPPSYNVATFDGALGNGRPYQITREEPGLTDSLVSCPINLQNIPSGQRGDIYVSFYWQLKGLGEIPESVDSIRLQLLDADTVWHTVWSESGGLENLSSLFRYEEISIQREETDERRFFHRNFKIKFEAFSTLRGIYDTWNIDYVYINRFRRTSQLGNPQSRTILDRAISKASQPLFGLYYELPIDQFRASPTITQQVVTLSNIDISDIHPVQYSHVLTNSNTGEVLAANLLVDGPLLRPGELDDYPGIDTTQLMAIRGDSIVIRSEFSFRSGDSPGIQEIGPDGDTVVFATADILTNDTISDSYLLQDHFAYDDGTAEFAAGINLDQGQVAVQFFIPDLDTLTHIDIYFPTLPTTAGQPMDIVIWGDLSEEREITRIPYIVEERNARNEFARIPLFDGLILRDTFYIGFQQFTDDYVAIGLDRSNDRATSKTWVNTSREWEQNTEISGALMIRPVFGDIDDLVLSTLPPMAKAITIYPNPTQGYLNIEGRFDQLEIYDIGGHRWITSDYSTELDVSILPSGLYLVRFHTGKQLTTTKLIIE